jgi:hypothetical protein
MVSSYIAYLEGQKRKYNGRRLLIPLINAAYQCRVGMPSQNAEPGCHDWTSIVNMDKLRLITHVKDSKDLTQIVLDADHK